MSGHSKWATIKRKKGAADAKRGQAFTKLAKAIAVAAREGEDPSSNYKLRIAIDKARVVNMPSANIEKSIARGAGKLGEQQIVEEIYEGYGPGGIAVIVQAATDNRNRTLPEVRSVFAKSGGSMAESGSVMFQFEQKGVIQLETTDTDAASLEAIDAGAQDLQVDQNTLTLYTESKNLKNVQQQLEAKGYSITTAELSFIPRNLVEISDVDVARKAIKLVDSLEELDDVVSVYTNFDIEPSVLEALS